MMRTAAERDFRDMRQQYRRIYLRRPIGLASSYIHDRRHYRRHHYELI